MKLSGDLNLCLQRRRTIPITTDDPQDISLPGEFLEGEIVAPVSKYRIIPSTSLKAIKLPTGQPVPPDVAQQMRFRHVDPLRFGARVTHRSTQQINDLRLKLRFVVCPIAVDFPGIAAELSPGHSTPGMDRVVRS